MISKIPKLQIMHFHAGCVPGFLYTNSVKELEGLNDTNLSGFPAKWIRRGEYYYYTSILKKRICRPVSECTHSDSWEKEHELQKLGMIIQAEAIQATNFTPDFAAMSPWGNQLIRQCIHEENGTMTCKTADKADSRI